jgi:hypothetical protein
MPSPPSPSSLSLSSPPLSPKFEIISGVCVGEPPPIVGVGRKIRQVVNTVGRSSGFAFPDSSRGKKFHAEGCHLQALWGSVLWNWRLGAG